MTKKRKECYVVFEGRKQGIFRTWEETEQYVKGYKGAVFRGYQRKEDAIRDMEGYMQDEYIAGHNDVDSDATRKTQDDTTVHSDALLKATKDVDRSDNSSTHRHTKSYTIASLLT